MKTWGYARCSTNEDKQDITRQIKELEGVSQILCKHQMSVQNMKS